MEKLELVKIANMSHPRWYPSATLMPNNKVVIMGGTQVRCAHGCESLLWGCVAQTTSHPVDLGAGAGVLTSKHTIWDPVYLTAPQDLH